MKEMWEEREREREYESGKKREGIDCVFLVF